MFVISLVFRELSRKSVYIVAPFFTYLFIIKSILSIFLSSIGNNKNIFLFSFFILFFSILLLIPPMTQVPSTLCPLLYFLFTILLSSVSTILFLPPILIFLLPNSCLFFMYFRNILLYDDMMILCFC